MKGAAEKIFDVLVASGMSENDAYSLLVQYLEEEAEVYVECLDLFKRAEQNQAEDKHLSITS